jgi:hypothetical protein
MAEGVIPRIVQDLDAYNSTRLFAAGIVLGSGCTAGLVLLIIIVVSRYISLRYS